MPPQRQSELMLWRLVSDSRRGVRHRRCPPARSQHIASYTRITVAPQPSVNLPGKSGQYVRTWFTTGPAA